MAMTSSSSEPSTHDRYHACVEHYATLHCNNPPNTPPPPDRTDSTYFRSIGDHFPHDSLNSYPQSIDLPPDNSAYPTFAQSGPSAVNGPLLLSTSVVPPQNRPRTPANTPIRDDRVLPPNEYRRLVDEGSIPQSHVPSGSQYFDGDRPASWSDNSPNMTEDDDFEHDPFATPSRVPAAMSVHNTIAPSMVVTDEAQSVRDEAPRSPVPWSQYVAYESNENTYDIDDSFLTEEQRRHRHAF